MKKQKIKIIVDETLNFVHGLKEDDVEVIKGHMFKNKEEINPSIEEFYKDLNLEDNFSTSQPTPEDFLKTYKKYPDSKLIVLTVPAKLSGTYNSAIIASKEVNNEITVIDSENTATGLGLLARKAVEDVKKGRDYKTIVEDVKKTVPRIKTLLLLTNLEYIIKSGRVSKSVGLLGKMVKLKPILGFEKGELKTMGKMLLFNDLVKGFYKFIKNKCKSVETIHLVSNNMLNEREKLKKLLENDGLKVHTYEYLTPIIGILSGPEGLCVSWIEE